MEASEVLAILRQRIRERIGGVVGHLPPSEIDALVDDIARIKFKYEGFGALRHTPARSHDGQLDGDGPT
jgi:hypothetical protein